MKKFILIFTSMIASLSYADVVNNGAELPQQNVRFAYQNIETYLDQCLNLSACDLNEKQKALLTYIRAALPQEKKTAEQIKFVSEKDNPGFFDGSHRVAKTGDDIGGFIYINSDMILQKDDDGTYQAITLAEAIRLLTHEFGHHHGDKDAAFKSEEFLDFLGTKVQVMAMSRLQSVEHSFVASYLAVRVMNFANKKIGAQMWITDGENMADIGPVAQKQLTCLRGTTLVGFNLSNLHWTYNYSRRGNLWTFQVYAWGVGFCATGGVVTRPFVRAPIVIDLDFDGTDRLHLKYVPNSARQGYLR